jgi:hypothetical protein
MMMDLQNTKCVMIIDEALPLGMIANTAAVMGVTIGKLFPEVVGPDVFDKDGNCHLGITAIPIPALKGNAALIRELREKMNQAKYAALTLIDFSNAAQSCNTYDAFIEKIANISESDLHYFGIAIFGDKKLVNQLTGSLALLR